MVKRIWQQSAGFRLRSMPSEREMPVTTQADAGIVCPDYKVTEPEPDEPESIARIKEFPAIPCFEPSQVPFHYHGHCSRNDKHTPQKGVCCNEGVSM